MSKRKLDDYLDDEIQINAQPTISGKKHSLDSDEEDDNEDAYDILQEEDIEGAEEVTSGLESEVRMTAFNMKEEMEEGHFDNEGHYHWKKEKLIQDNWLDSIDWHTIRKNPEGNKEIKEKNYLKGLGEESDSESEKDEKFNEIASYKQILQYMKPGESVAKSLKRLGGSSKKLSSQERWKLKKAGIEPTTSKEVTELTELANNLLTQTGNMDIYQETHEMISNKIKNAEKCSMAKEAEFDIFSDNFAEKEKTDKAHSSTSQEAQSSTSTDKTSTETTSLSSEVTWEYKWKQNASDINGPHSTQQMHKWAEEGYFKEGVWVRKCGENGPFYTSNRIDFELYY